MVPLVSIIIPVYNVRDYLRQCIESVINQTIREIEVLLIDDGSFDGSNDICDEFAKQYNNIRVIHKMNEGVSVARNKGIQEARGKWIMFVDGDDWLEKDAIESLLDADIEGSDLLVGTCMKEYVGYSEPDAGDFISNSVLTRREFQNELIGSCLVNISATTGLFPENMSCGPQLTYPVMKLYKRDILINNNVLFPKDIIICEDKIFNLRYLLCVDRISFVNKKIYHYRMRAGSATNSFGKRIDGIKQYAKAILLLSEELNICKIAQPYYSINIVQLCVHQGKLFSRRINSIKDLFHYSREYSNLMKNECINKCLTIVNMHNMSNSKMKLLYICLRAKAYWLIMILFYISRIIKKDHVFYT